MNAIVTGKEIVLSVDVVDIWKKYERMVYSRCHSFYNTTKIAVEELIGVAKVKFMQLIDKYKHKTIEEFGKILYISITNALKDFIKKEYGKYELPEEYDEVWNPEYMRMEDIKRQLSDDAKNLVDKTLEKGVITRTEVAEIAKNELHLTQSKIWKCIKEIKQLLREF